MYSTKKKMAPDKVLGYALYHVLSVVLITFTAITWYYELFRKERYFYLEWTIDTILLCDITYRMIDLKRKFFQTLTNILDVVSIFIVVVHWVVFVALPVYDNFDFSWILFRYIVQFSRLYYLLHINSTVLRKVYAHKSYSAVRVEDDREAPAPTHAGRLKYQTLLNALTGDTFQGIRCQKLDMDDCRYLVMAEAKHVVWLFVFTNRFTMCDVAEKKKHRRRLENKVLVKRAALDDDNHVSFVNVNARYAIDLAKNILYVDDKAQPSSVRIRLFVEAAVDDYV